MNNEFILDKDTLENIGDKIKDYFNKDGHFVIIKNYNYLHENHDTILDMYNKINKYIGKYACIDLEENTYKPTDKNWTDVKYYVGSDEKQFWRSSKHQNLHTDNSFATSEYFAKLTELICLKPSEFSGHTTIISNDKLVNLIKYNDKLTNNNLFYRILNKELYFSIDNNYQVKKHILTENNSKYIFNFNYYPAIRAINSPEDIKLIEELHNFFEEKIMYSCDLMHDIKLNYGDAVIFNDELVMHGRRSFIGTRYYKKCGINLENIITSFTFIKENKNINIS
jgi:hypothetical protein